MKKLLTYALLVLFTGAVGAATLEEDMERDGVSVWHKKNVSKSEMISMMRDYEVVTATNAIAYSECGKTFFLNSATEFASTLPLPQAGCYFKFIVAAAPAAASYTVVTSGSGNILIGGINELEVDTSDDGPYDNNGDTITFADGVAVVGDYAELISDGTSWFINGQANADGGITVTGS